MEPISLQNEQALVTKYRQAAPKGKGKYKRKPRTSEGFAECEVHEYVRLDETVGYQLFMFAEKAGTSYIKSIGYGPEAASRTFDWQKFILD